MERVRDRTGLATLVEQVDDELIDEIAEGMFAAMSAGVHEAEIDADIGADARAASHESARGFLLGMAEEPWGVREQPRALSDLARTLARRGLDVSVLMKLTRYGQGVFWPAIMELAERAIEEPSTRMRVLGVAFDRLGRYVETVLGAAVGAFQEERDLRMRGAHARRRELIEALLSGEPLAIDSVSRALDYELGRLHTALALWDAEHSHPPSDGMLVRLEAVAGQVGAALGGRRILCLPSGSRGVWAWVATEAPPGPSQRAAIAQLELPAGQHVAIGAAGHGPEGFRRSHEEALAAQRLATAASDLPAVTWYADVEIASLLSRDSRRARALVARELAGLTGTDPSSEKLRATALAYLGCAGSATAAGRELGVHTNTVRYRVERAQDALGRTLQGPQLPLQLALMLVQTVGPAILSD
jgi:hypothetical protein